ncbi:type IV pilus biogenesis protein PilM [Brevibacillus dissolubilis]|uniref:type IV pilus biogenesis protein PilM n=1 Tax=Brevibacillus dissolubilis TaxID=1844116 RepID=UPI001116B84B|nr:pilus assembly protein PilM [Brevibacillus dissolubilis]
MRLSLPFMKKKHRLGATIEDTGIRLVEARKQGSRYVLEQTVFIPFPQGSVSGGKIINKEAVELAIALAKKDLNLKSRQVNLAVPSSFVVVRRHALPPLLAKDARALIEIELDTTIHLPFTRPYFDIHKLETGAAMTPAQAPTTEGEAEAAATSQDEYLIVAAPGDVIDQYVELLRLLDLKVVAADIEPLALYRLLDLTDKPMAQDIMFVQLEPGFANVSMFSRDTPEFLRNIPLDLNTYAPDISSSADLYEALDDEYVFQAFTADLVRELERVINFYQFTYKNDGTRIKAIYLTGDFPFLDNILQHLRERINNAELMLFPTQSLRHAYLESTDLQAYTVAAGLSLRG